MFKYKPKAKPVVAQTKKLVKASTGPSPEVAKKLGLK